MGNLSELTLKGFGGVEFGVHPSFMKKHRSPDMKNMLADRYGVLQKRAGFQKLYDVALGSEAINGLFWNQTHSHFVIAYGTKLYRYNENGTMKELMSGLSNTKMREFVMGDKQYFLNGSQYIIYDGVDAKKVSDIAYVPTTTIWQYNTALQQLSSEKSESYNLCTDRFRECYNLSALPSGKTIFPLKEQNLASTPNIKLYDATGREYVSGFTLDYSLNKYSVITNYQISAPTIFYVEASRNTSALKQKTWVVLDTPNFMCAGVFTLIVDLTNYTVNVSNADTIDAVTQRLLSQYQSIWDANGLTVTLSSDILKHTFMGNDNLNRLGLLFESKVLNQKVKFHYQSGSTGIHTVLFEKQAPKADTIQVIDHCSLAGIYGGQNDTRVFLTGNTDYPNRDYQSALYDPTYFPEDSYTEIGNSGEKITGYTVQYDSMVVFKENSIWLRRALDTGDAVFSVRPIQDEIGLIAPDTLVLLQNSPTGILSGGLGALVASQVRDERNIKNYGQQVETLFKNHTGLQNAIAVDFDGKYYLKIDDWVYVWDYDMDEWYPWSDIPVTCFLLKGDRLYFGGKNGMCYSFSKFTDPSPYHDNGLPIQAYWKSRQLNFGSDSNLKTVQKLFYTVADGENLSATVSVWLNDGTEIPLSDSKEMSGVGREVKNLENGGLFTLTGVARLKHRKGTSIQIGFTNDRINEGMQIFSATLTYQNERNIR